MMTDEELATLIVQKNFKDWLDNPKKLQINKDMAEAVKFLDCEKNTPVSLMYCAFKAGLNAGLELAVKLDKMTNPKPPQQQELFSLREVAEKLNISYQLARKMVRDGRLPAMKMGRVWRVSQTDIDNYLNQ